MLLPDNYNYLISNNVKIYSVTVKVNQNKKYCPTCGRSGSNKLKSNYIQ